MTTDVRLFIGRDITTRNLKDRNDNGNAIHLADSPRYQREAARLESRTVHCRHRLTVSHDHHCQENCFEAGETAREHIVYCERPKWLNLNKLKPLLCTTLDISHSRNHNAFPYLLGKNKPDSLAGLSKETTHRKPHGITLPSTFAFTPRRILQGSSSLQQALIHPRRQRAPSDSFITYS